MLTTQILDNLSKFIPETILTISILVIFIVELFFKKKTRISGWIALIGIIITFIFTILQMAFPKQSLFFNMIVIDPFSSFFKLIFLLSGFLIILFSFLSEEIRTTEYRTQEYYALILTLTLGGFFMASSINLLMMYLSLELVSLSSYIMAGYFKKQKRSSEAALKYVIYGAVSSGLMLFGISILYGVCGSTDIITISNYLSTNPVNLVTLLISIFLIIAGFGYKISAVPVFPMRSPVRFMEDFPPLKSAESSISASGLTRKGSFRAPPLRRNTPSMRGSSVSEKRRSATERSDCRFPATCNGHKERASIRSPVEAH